MGQAAAHKVTEIEETRARIEADLRALEERLPSPVRSAKSLLGIALGGTALTALLLKARRKPQERPTAEVTVRIVRED